MYSQMLNLCQTATVDFTVLYTVCQITAISMDHCVALKGDKEYNDDKNGQIRFRQHRTKRPTRVQRRLGRQMPQEVYKAGRTGHFRSVSKPE